MNRQMLREYYPAGCFGYSVLGTHSNELPYRLFQGFCRLGTDRCQVLGLEVIVEYCD